MDMESFPLLLAKGHKLLDVSRGVEAVLGEGKRGMGRLFWLFFPLRMDKLAIFELNRVIKSKLGDINLYLREEKKVEL